QFETSERFVVGRKIIFHATDLAQITVFGTNRGVIEPRRNRVGQLNLAILVREQKRFCSLKNTQSSSLKSRRVFAGLNSLAAGFDANHAHARIAQKRMEQTNGVAAATDAGDKQIG